MAEGDEGPITTARSTWGYISCPGDDGQPSFEVALFRLRDGRPLMAVGSAELEGDQKRGMYLKFYELGDDGKMHASRRSFLPIKDVDNARSKWSFDLPQHGRTIVFRAYATGGRDLSLHMEWRKVFSELSDRTAKPDAQECPRIGFVGGVSCRGCAETDSAPSNGSGAVPSTQCETRSRKNISIAPFLAT
jgi:hypothetical protein